MKKFSMILVVLALVLCLFTGCRNVSTQDNGNVGNDNNTPAGDIVDGVEEGVNDIVEPNHNNPANQNGSTPNNNAAGDNNTPAGDNAAPNDSNAAAEENAATNQGTTDNTPQERASRGIIRGTGTADMVTGEEPARDRNTIAG